MLSLENISVNAGTKELLRQANFKIEAGERYGLIGVNGAGKSTLLRVVMGQHPKESGSISMRKGSRIGFLSQDFLELNINRTVYQLAEEAFAEVLQLQAKMDKLTEEVMAMTDYETDVYFDALEEMGNLQHRLDVLDASKKEARIEQMLLGLGFKRTDFQRPLEEFSGGWRMRVLLAKLLLEEPDLLLLDEPTNHLDIDSIEWLENYIQTYPGAVMIVSHDQFFLDRMVTGIAEIRGKKITAFPGTFTEFQEWIEEQREMQQTRFEAQQREIAHQQRFIERFKAKANFASRAQSRVKMLEKIERIEAPEEDEATISFRFPEPPRAGQVILEIEKLRKTYPHPKGTVEVFTSEQTLQLERGSKVALVGPNGAGKSTLARIAIGTEPFDGKLIGGHNVITAHFAQHLADELNPKMTLLEEMESNARTTEARQMIRGVLGCFLFRGDDVFKRIGVLSGGERSRLALAKILLSPVNFLILDEPTNHLDIPSKTMLAEALKLYKGTLLVISHDRHFIQQFATTVWRAEGGRVIVYEGGFDYYDWKRKQLAAEEEQAQKTAQKNAPAAKAAPKDPVAEEKQRAQQQKKKASELEKRMADLDKEVKEMERRMQEPEFFLLDDAPQITRRYNEAKAQLEKVEAEWLEASQ
jgi:ATP-binding cassette subfamily F protein 3